MLVYAYIVKYLSKLIQKKMIVILKLYNILITELHIT